MKGSEKQLSWANDLAGKAISTLEWAKENPADVGKADPETWNNAIDLLIGRIRSAEYAGYIIDAFSYIVFNENNEQAFMKIITAMNSRTIPCKF